MRRKRKSYGGGHSPCSHFGGAGDHRVGGGAGPPTVFVLFKGVSPCSTSFLKPW